MMRYKRERYQTLGITHLPIKMASASESSASDSLSKDFLIVFEYSSTPSSKVERATIFFPERKWKWELHLKDFEVVHGLSRIVRLIPDKAYTARSINNDRRVDDDGSFLIELVEKLARNFSILHNERMASAEALDAPEDLQRFKVEYGPHEEGSIDTTECDVNLAMALEEYNRSIFNMKNCLILDQRDDYDRITAETLKMSDDLLLASQIFLDLIHPIWVMINRSGEVNNITIDSIMVACESRLIDYEGRISREYFKAIAESEL